VPVVFTFHTLYHRYLHYAPLPHWYSRPYTIKRVRRHCRLCKHIIAPSHAIERIVRFFKPKAPISVVPTGVRLERFQQGDERGVRARHGIAPDDIVLLYVGRIVYEKNLEFLLRAVAPLLGHRVSKQRVRFLMVGGGPALRPMLKFAADLGVKDDVICTDFVNPPNMPDYFAAGDIFTFASRTETQGVSIAEALAAGLPCVVVGALGAAESVTPDGNGFVVQPNEDAFRAAVLKLACEPQLRALMAAHAREHAPNLALEGNVDKLVAIYAGLVR
jgi:glycosyltransferase involved in cell wall biosynthesis